MQDVIKRSIEQLNEVLTKDKKLVIKSTTPLIDEKSNLESIDIVNLFVNLEKNLKKEDNIILTFDEILENSDKLKTVNDRNFPKLELLYSFVIITMRWDIAKFCPYQRSKNSQN